MRIEIKMTGPQACGKTRTMRQLEKTINSFVHGDLKVSHDSDNHVMIVETNDNHEIGYKE